MWNVFDILGHAAFLSKIQFWLTLLKVLISEVDEKVHFFWESDEIAMHENKIGEIALPNVHN